MDNPTPDALVLFKQEGAFLFAAQQAADRFAERVNATTGAVHIHHDEAFELARAFARVVRIASDYHLRAAT